MSDRTRVLLLDDGELDHVADVLEFVGVACERLQGAGIGAAVAAPTDLLITSALRAVSLPFLSLAPGHAEPTWLVMHDADSEAGLRTELRAIGAHFVARSDVDTESLRLLLGQILYRGPERRGAARVPVDAPAVLELVDNTRVEARIVDWTRNAVRLEAKEEVSRGESPLLELPETLCGERFSVPVNVVRSDANAVVVRFQPETREMRTQLDELFARIETEAAVATLAARQAAGIESRGDAAYVDGTGIPDWESLASTAERRQTERQPYEGTVVALPDGEGGPPEQSRVCISHDLSPDGIRLLGMPDLPEGHRVTLALHAGHRLEPIVVTAEVRRSDDTGTGFAFIDHDARVRRRIGQLLQGQAPLESLVGGEVQPVVLSRVLDDWAEDMIGADPGGPSSQSH